MVGSKTSTTLIYRFVCQDLFSYFVLNNQPGLVPNILQHIKDITSIIVSSKTRRSPALD